ncbi:hypothetical protein [Krasilnikovia sp. MM14-A1259]|uniref:hypothetical protein n=1 Tax=Krasilnikovia sp. MM14-A1259 TaxID=3373539 RepID=UPI003826C3BD
MVESERRVVLWSTSVLGIIALLRRDGRLVFEGQDLNPDNPWGGCEYEYAITVEPADVPRVVAALGGAESDDVLALLKANAERVVTTGEKSWLLGLGIEPGFWSRVGD